jgi:GT2 family glycosyltransferase
MTELVRADKKEMSALSPIRELLYDADIYPASKGDYQLDILLPTYGNINLTMECVNSLYSCTSTPFHLIVLNADRDNDFGITHTWFMEFRKTHPNITYCHRYHTWKEGNQFFNLGLKYCRTEYAATVMNSMRVEPYWERPALKIMREDPYVGTVGLKCLFPDGRIESAGIVFNGIVPTDYGRDEDGWRHCETRVDVPCVQWAFALHRKAAIDGNLEEDVFNGHVGWDDIDNNFCVRNKGWKIVYCGQGVGIHKPRATRGNNSNEAMIANQQNAHTFYKRWGLWERYLEGEKMDVSNSLKKETKAILSNCITEYQVLQKFLARANNDLFALSAEALKEVGVSPEQYVLEMNPLTNTWIIKPRVDQSKKSTFDPNDIKQIPVKHDVIPEKELAKIQDASGDTKHECVEKPIESIPPIIEEVKTQ